MGSAEAKYEARQKRKKRIRKKVFGSEERPRLSVFRSTRHIYAQLVDDVHGQTLAAASSVEKEVREKGSAENKTGVAGQIGKMLAQRALAKGIQKAVFDRNGFLYHGRVKAVAEGAREGGLNF